MTYIDGQARSVPLSRLQKHRLPVKLEMRVALAIRSEVAPQLAITRDQMFRLIDAVKLAERYDASACEVRCTTQP